VDRAWREASCGVSFGGGGGGRGRGWESGTRAAGAGHAGDWFVGSRRAGRQNRAPKNVDAYTTGLSSSRDLETKEMEGLGG
jgi:hypothetical protein